MSSQDFEADVLVLAFRDAGTLSKYAERLDPIFFKNIVYGNIWLVLRRLFNKFRQPPSYSAVEAYIMTELSREGGLKLFTVEDIPSINTMLTKFSNPEGYIMDRWVVQQLDQWIATRVYTIAAVKAEQALASGDPSIVPAIFRAATAVASGGSTQPIDFFDRIKEIAQAQAFDGGRQIGTGLTTLDIALAGGLQQGEFGVVFGVQSVGKSFLCTHIGAHNTMVEENRVLHITNELTVRAQERRYVSWLTGIAKRSLWEQAETISNEQYAHLRGRLTVVYLSPGSTVNDVWAILEGARLEGRPYKLVVVDYLDQFSPVQKTEAKEYLRLIALYSEFSSLAKAQDEGGQDCCILAVTHADSSAYGRLWGGDGAIMGGSKIGKNKVIDFGIYLGQDEDFQNKKLVAVTITKMREREGQGSRCYLRQTFDTAHFVDAIAPPEMPQLETPNLP